MNRKPFTEDEFTEAELNLLKTIFKMADEMAEGIRTNTFAEDLSVSNTLFELTEKLGINDIIY